MARGPRASEQRQRRTEIGSPQSCFALHVPFPVSVHAFCPGLAAMCASKAKRIGARGTRIRGLPASQIHVDRSHPKTSQYSYCAVMSFDFFEESCGRMVDCDASNATANISPGRIWNEQLARRLRLIDRAAALRAARRAAGPAPCRRASCRHHESSRSRNRSWSKVAPTRSPSRGSSRSSRAHTWARALA